MKSSLNSTKIWKIDGQFDFSLSILGLLIDWLIGPVIKAILHTPCWLSNKISGTKKQTWSPLILNSFLVWNDTKIGIKNRSFFFFEIWSHSPLNGKVQRLLLQPRVIKGIGWTKTQLDRISSGCQIGFHSNSHPVGHGPSRSYLPKVEPNKWEEKEKRGQMKTTDL